MDLEAEAVVLPGDPEGLAQWEARNARALAVVRWQQACAKGRPTRGDLARRAEDMAERYLAGQSVRAIARVYGVSHPRVVQVLKGWLLPEEKEAARARRVGKS